MQSAHWLHPDADITCCWWPSYHVRHKFNYRCIFPTLFKKYPPYSYYSVSIFCKFGVDGFIGTIVMFVLMFFGQIAGVILVDKVNHWLHVDIAIQLYVGWWGGMSCNTSISYCMGSSATRRLLAQ